MDSNYSRTCPRSDGIYFPARSQPHAYLKPGMGAIAKNREVDDSIRSRRLFVCGLHPDKWNSRQKSIFFDLLHHYYVACNDDNVIDNKQTQALLAESDAFVFFLNNRTIADKNCLLTLQYAWHMMLPIIILRPPRKQFVLCKIDYQRRWDMRIPRNGSIVKHVGAKSIYLGERYMGTVDYPLLTEILYEGFQLSVIYDREQHTKSMEIIKKRIKCVLTVSVDKGTQTDPVSHTKAIQTETSLFDEEREMLEKEERERKYYVGYHPLDEEECALQ